MFKGGLLDHRPCDCSHTLEKENMNLTDYKVRRIISPHGDLQLGEPVDIIDERGFYRIARTHIIDKFKIEKIKENGNRLEIKMKDGTVVLVV